MSILDDLYGALDFISPLLHTAARARRTHARNKTSRTASAAVRISVPHPGTEVGQQASCPGRDEVIAHLAANGVRAWTSNYNGRWMYIVVRTSQQTQAKWLLSGNLTVTDRSQLRSFAQKWKR